MSKIVMGYAGSEAVYGYDEPTKVRVSAFWSCKACHSYPQHQIQTDSVAGDLLTSAFHCPCCGAAAGADQMRLTRAA